MQCQLYMTDSETFRDTCYVQEVVPRQTFDPRRSILSHPFFLSVLLYAYLICGSGLSPDQQAMWI